MQPSAIITEYASNNKTLWYLLDPQTRIDDLSIWHIILTECTAAEHMLYYLSNEKVVGLSVTTMCCSRFVGLHQQLLTRW